MNMNFGLRKEEAYFLYDLILYEVMEYGEKRLKEIYGDIDISGMLRQLAIIKEIGDSVEEDKEINRILGI